MRNALTAVRKAALAATMVVVLGAAGEARADELDRATDEARLGVATVFANVFYIPAKIGYAAIGGVTGGLGYVVTGGSRHVAEKIWVSSLGGDYVLTRQMVAGEEDIRFSGTPITLNAAALTGEN